MFPGDLEQPNQFLSRVRYSMNAIALHYTTYNNRSILMYCTRYLLRIDTIHYNTVR